MKVMIFVFTTAWYDFWALDFLFTGLHSTYFTGIESGTCIGNKKSELFFFFFLFFWKGEGVCVCHSVCRSSNQNKQHPLRKNAITVEGTWQFLVCVLL